MPLSSPRSACPTRTSRASRPTPLVVGVARGADGPVLADGGALPRGAARQAGGRARRRSARPARPTRSSSSPAGKALERPGARRCRPGQAPAGKDAGYDHEALRRAAGAASRALAGTASVGLRAARHGRRRRSAPSPRARCSAPTRSPATAAAPTAEQTPPVADVTVVTALARDKAAKAAAAPRAAWSPRRSTWPATWSTPPPATCTRPRSPTRSSTPRRATPARGRGARREGARARAATAASSASARARRDPPRLVKVAYAPRGARQGTSRWSARASRSTPAASRSSPPAGMEWMKSDMGGAAAVVAAIARRSPGSSLTVKVTALAAAGREHAVRHRAAARPTCSHVRRHAPSRCSTPTPRAGWCWPTRIVARQRGAPGRDRRRRDADRRAGASRSASGRPASWATTTTARGRRRTPRRARRRAACGRCRCPTELRAGLDSEVADIANIGDRDRRHARRRPVPAGVRRPERHRRGRTSTSPARRSTRATAVRLHAQGRHRAPGAHPGARWPRTKPRAEGRTGDPGGRPVTDGHRGSMWPVASRSAAAVAPQPRSVP